MCRRNSVLNRYYPSPTRGEGVKKGVRARRAVPVQPCLTKSGIGDFISIHAIALAAYLTYSLWQHMAYLIAGLIYARPYTMAMDGARLS
ncbi:hypothetical protein AGMMS50289_17560 [Betaproteobacteria bacterium]|nr:hypothetical protein AGMMS50289_17560 [Betaproteobacteria bacterium]